MCVCIYVCIYIYIHTWNRPVYVYVCLWTHAHVICTLVFMYTMIPRSFKQIVLSYISTDTHTQVYMHRLYYDSKILQTNRPRKIISYISTNSYTTQYICTAIMFFKGVCTHLYYVTVFASSPFTYMYGHGHVYCHSSMWTTSCYLLCELSAFTYIYGRANILSLKNVKNICMYLYYLLCELNIMDVHICMVFQGYLSVYITFFTGTALHTSLWICTDNRR